MSEKEMKVLEICNLDKIRKEDMALIITGAATNVCVYATALDAFQRDMYVVVLSDCVAPTAMEFQQPFLRNIYYLLGDVVTGDKFMEYYG